MSMDDPNVPVYEDPFAEDWDDAEMGRKASEYQRLLDDVGDVDSEPEPESKPTMEGENALGEGEVESSNQP